MQIDMSEKAILRRLKTVDRLRALCIALMKAKKPIDEFSVLDKEMQLDSKFAIHPPQHISSQKSRK